MQVYLVKTRVSSTPIAEIRTDGRIMEFIIDNTQGKLPRLVGTDFGKLKQLASDSSYMYLDQHSTPSANILRYLMSNGDIVEITTDGKTVEINGEMISGEEKDELFAAIRAGTLTVAQKADPSKPTPVIPVPQDNAPKSPVPSPKMNMMVVKNMTNNLTKKDEKEAKGSAFHDPSIESKNFGPDDEQFKNMAYYLKYGCYKGEDPNG